MLIEPRRGATAADLHTALREVHRRAFDVFVGDSDVNKVVTQYLGWVGRSEQVLKPVLDTVDLDRVLLTRRYWAVLANPESSRVNIATVRQEVTDLQLRFDELTRATLAEGQRWTAAHPETYFVVADTNVFLHHPDDLAAIEWREQIELPNRVNSMIRLVIPILIVDELDNNKNSNKLDAKAKTRARTTLKALYDAFGTTPESVWTIRQATPEVGGVTAELLMDNPGHHRMERADDELIDRSLMLRDFVGDSLHFVSYDTGARLRARAAGLPAHHPTHHKP